MPITYDTELYRDLRIYGDDLFELLFWINKEFEVKLDFNFAAYAHPERPLTGLWKVARKMLGKGEPQYKSLKIRDLIAAIEAKRWPDEA